jgi:hypothetical protein
MRCQNNYIGDIMLVKDLLVELQKLDPEMEVILQRDSEGNSYSPMLGLDSECIYIPETTWYGTIYSTDWLSEDACMEEHEWQETLLKPRCVIFYPIN